MDLRNRSSELRRVIGLVLMGIDVKEAAVVQASSSQVNDGEWWEVPWVTVKRRIEGDRTGWHASPRGRDLCLRRRETIALKDIGGLGGSGPPSHSD